MTHTILRMVRNERIERRWWQFFFLGGKPIVSDRNDELVEVAYPRILHFVDLVGGTHATVVADLVDHRSTAFPT